MASYLKDAPDREARKARIGRQRWRWWEDTGYYTIEGFHPYPSTDGRRQQSKRWIYMKLYNN